MATGVSMNPDAAALLRQLSYRLSNKWKRRVSISETVKIAVRAANKMEDEQADKTLIAEQVSA